MAKKSEPPKNPRRLLEDRVVLQEVLDRLRMTDAPVRVICSVEEGWSVTEVIEFLDDLDITVSRKQGDHTDYYVFATLKNEKQAEKIDSELKRGKTPCIGHVWLDKEIRTCVATSEKTINVPAARNLFSSTGKDIHWAVLDTGIYSKHKCFNQSSDGCMVREHINYVGESTDPDPHGTHVAGIIATIAPGVTLYDYTVLGPDGGSSSTIIRAMHDIRKKNFDAGRAVIHGVNMSLGGPVPVPSYGCGWSPECQEANRLVLSGVVVCVAAGNDGHKDLATVPDGRLDIFSTYIDLGITDPGNAEEVITVGSTHKTNPHSYGPSFFSSKGPTGDGRYKPDCLAPGEKIVSARAGTSDGVLTLDGTSMATPHVSGAIAVFMSAKPEFKGRAREVKRILLDSCTDLGRDRYFQGAGLVDLLRMIQSV